MIQNIFKLFFLMFIFSFLSCEKALEIDESEFNKKIVVDGVVDNGTCTFYLTQNISTLSRDSVTYIKGGNININNTKIDEQENCYTHSFNALSEGGELSLNISKPGFPSVTSSAIVPSKPHFTIGDVKWVTDKEYFWNQKHIVITINLTDTKNTFPDYYIVELDKVWYVNDSYYDNEQRIWLNNKKQIKESQIIYINDNCAEIVSNGGLDFRLNKTKFTLSDDMVFPKAIVVIDNSFDGKEKELSIHCSQYIVGYIAEIKVSSINSGYYEFIQSVAAYKFNNSIFNDPVRIKSNINGGLGYFGIKTTATDSIKIINIK